MAFQFDHPRLHPYFVEAAQAMRQQLSDSQRGERFPVRDPSGYLPSTVGWTGVNRRTSDSIAYLLDSGRFSYESIGKALDDIIHNNGQENYAAAKRVELVLDDMLTNGYADVDSRPHGPNEAYIAEKSKIPGAEVTGAEQQTDGDYFAALVEDGYDAAQERAQQTQEAPQETEAERRKRESYKDVPGLRWKSVAPARVDELLRTGLAELDGQQGVGNDGEVADAWQYSISEDYESEYDRWIADGKSDRKSLYVGTTSEALKSIGIKDTQIFWNTTKINSIQKDHPFMSDGVMKQVPHILENPILIMESKTQPNRVTMYGEVYADNGIPVMAVLELAPRSSKGYELQNMVIANAYNKGADVENASIEATQRLIDGSNILYVDPDKKRTDNWLSQNRLQLPLGITSYGPIHNITLVARDSQGNFSADAKNSDLPEWKKNLQEYSKEQFSVSEDSQGRELSEAQQEYFRDSAVRDEDGRLLVMYHGTRAENGDFTVFDYSKAVKKGGLGLKALGKGNYFTSKQLNGTERFGSRVIEAYLNITNPFVYDGSAGDTVSLAEQVQKKTGTDTQGMSYDALQDAMRDLGYDGVVEYRRDGSLGIAVTFDSEQIKNVTNQNPTGDPDIRYSINEGKTQDELLDFVTQFQRATEERFRDVPKESTKGTTKESAEDNAAAIRGDLEQLAELARQSAEAQGIKRLTPEETAESKVNARVGEEKPGFRDRLRHPGQTLREAGENIRDTGRYFYRMLVDSGEAVSRVGKQSGDRHLYAYYNKARASTNAAISMIENAATDINGRVTGKSLNAVLDPIRAKGDDYYNRFQLYLFHLHNVDRMSIENMGLVENARDALAKFREENPELNQYTNAEILFDVRLKYKSGAVRRIGHVPAFDGAVRKLGHVHRRIYCTLPPRKCQHQLR